MDTARTRQTVTVYVYRLCRLARPVFTSGSGLDTGLSLSRVDTKGNAKRVRREPGMARLDRSAPDTSSRINVTTG